MACVHLGQSLTDGALPTVTLHHGNSTCPSHTGTGPAVTNCPSPVTGGEPQGWVWMGRMAAGSGVRLGCSTGPAIPLPWHRARSLLLPIPSPQSRAVLQAHTPRASVCWGPVSLAHVPSKGWRHWLNQQLSHWINTELRSTASTVPVPVRIHQPAKP